MVSGRGGKAQGIKVGCRGKVGRLLVLSPIIVTELLSSLDLLTNEISTRLLFVCLIHLHLSPSLLSKAP